MPRFHLSLPLIVLLALVTAGCSLAKAPAAARPTVVPAVASEDPGTAGGASPSAAGTSVTAGATTRPRSTARTDKTGLVAGDNGAGAATVADPSGEPTARPGPSETPDRDPTPIEKPVPTPTSRPLPLRTLYITTEQYADANLRAKPSITAEIIRTLPYRASVRADAIPRRDADGDEWYRVRYGSESGYVAATLLSAQQPRSKPPGLRGVVADAGTGDPVAGAWVYLGNDIVRTTNEGRYTFRLPPGDETLTVMAPGYAKFEAQAAAVQKGRVSLEPFDARGVYLPFFSAARPEDADRIFAMIEDTTLNSIVIDIKSDEGLVWKTSVPLAKDIGASVDSMDLRAFTAEAHRRGIYVIGRFTVFKDPKLATARPGLAIRSSEGGLWEDAPRVRYADPFDGDAWQYLGDLAVDLAAQGIDEIQYDYIRFPVDGDVSTARYDEDATPESRPAQITSFVRYMEQRLRPSRVFISADIFGRVVFHPVDVDTGQILEDFVEHVDYVSPMLYPSGFNRGSGGFDYPTRNSYGLIKESLRLTNERLAGIGVRTRPWLQSFKDYQFGDPYGLPQYLEQRRAAEEMGTSGWLFWNPAAVYDERTFMGGP